MTEAGAAASVLPAAKQALLQPMPRRSRLVDATHEETTLRVRRVSMPGVSKRLAAARAGVWGRAFLRLAARALGDRLDGRRDQASRGARLRAFFEEVGGTGIKIGQQLSSRVDMLPFEVCAELALLTDRVEPFPFEHAVARVESALGRRLGEVFAIFDPEPIGSASIACVYQARLLTGERVAVKVQRPRVAETFAADVECADLLTRALELLTVVRPGFFKHLRTEVENLFYQELDFVQEARYQTLFRRAAKRSGLGWLSAPKVRHDLSTIDVLVTEYVEGFQIAELVAAVEAGDEVALAAFRALDIEPRTVARRVLHQGWWGRYEQPFFHADPHPANILVRPGNEIVMLDFGSCGVTSARQRRNDIAFHRYAARDDMSAAIEAAMNNAMPMPHVDVEELRTRMERYIWANRLAQISSDAEWWERTTAGVFLGLARANRELHIPLIPNMLEIMRASLLYDTLALRLYPGFNLNRLFNRYRRKAERRELRRMRRRMRRTRAADHAVRLYAEAARLEDTVEWGGYWLESLTGRLPVGFGLLSRKGPYLFAVLLRLLAGAALVAGAAAGVGWCLAELSGGARPFPEVLRSTLGHPVYLAAAGLMVLQSLRRIAFRLADPDP